MQADTLPNKLIINSLLIKCDKDVWLQRKSSDILNMKKYAVAVFSQCHLVSSLSSWGELSELEMDPSIGKYVCTQLHVC